MNTNPPKHVLGAVRCEDVDPPQMPKPRKLIKLDEGFWVDPNLVVLIERKVRTDYAAPRVDQVTAVVQAASGLLGSTIHVTRDGDGRESAEDKAERWARLIEKAKQD